MRILCIFGLHKWVLYRKELHTYQSLNGFSPTIDFYYGCNGCGNRKVETREEGTWLTFKPEHLKHDIKGGE